MLRVLGDHGMVVVFVVVFTVSVLGQLVEMERSGLDSEEFLEKLRQSTLKLREMEHNLLAAKKDVANYQDMLEQSQVSFVVVLWLSQCRLVVVNGTLMSRCENV
jgi:hypothetical protein